MGHRRERHKCRHETKTNEPVPNYLPSLRYHCHPRSGGRARNSGAFISKSWSLSTGGAGWIGQTGERRTRSGQRVVLASASGTGLPLQVLRMWADTSDIADPHSFFTHETRQMTAGAPPAPTLDLPVEPAVDHLPWAQMGAGAAAAVAEVEDHFATSRVGAPLKAGGARRMASRVPPPGGRRPAPAAAPARARSERTIPISTVARRRWWETVSSLLALLFPPSDLMA